LAKDASQSGRNQYWGYTIPRAFMTPWARNLISNGFINFFVVLAKPHKNHELTEIGKKQMKEINKKKHKKIGNVLGHYPCTSFSPMIQQQQKHLLPHMMESQSPNLDAVPKYVGHLLQL
jgi:hypothetical protein